MRLRPEISLEIELEIALRRPPRRFLELLAESEGEFRRTIARIEAGPAFARLVERGAVRRTPARGRIPPTKYEAYLERQATRVLDRYSIRARVGWQEDFFAPDAAERLDELAAKYEAPAEELEFVVRYLKRLVSGDGPPPRDVPLERPLHGPPQAPDLSGPLLEVQRFVDAHSLTPEQFRRDFLAGDRDADSLARAYRAEPAEIEAVLQALDAVYYADAPAAPPEPPGRPRPGPRTVGAVVIWPQGEPELHFTEDGAYAARYRLDPSACAGAEDRALLAELRWINQRRSLIWRIAHHLVESQARYLQTGDELDLRPLSQADLARALGQAPSTVSRAVRAKYLDTPRGTLALAFLCQDKGEVVRRLHARHPDWSDRRLQQELEARGCRLSRRTVAYHRHGE